MLLNNQSLNKFNRSVTTECRTGVINISATFREVLGSNIGTEIGYHAISRDFSQSPPQEIPNDILK